MGKQKKKSQKVRNYPSVKQFKNCEKKETSEKRADILFIALSIVIICGISTICIWVLSIAPKHENKLTVAKADKPSYLTWEKNLSFYDFEIRKMLQDFTEKLVAEDIEQAQNLEELLYRITKLIDPNFTLAELNQFLNNCVNEIRQSGWGPGKKHFDLLAVKQKLEAIGSYLTRDKNFQYSSSIFNPSPFVKDNDGKTKVKDKKAEDTAPELYSITNLIRRKTGNCSTMPVIYAMIAQRLGLAVKLVGIRDHLLARFDDGQTRINIETTNPKGMGVGTPDKFYIDLLKPSGLMLRNSSCMKTLNLRETAGVLFINQVAYLGKSKAEPYLIKRAIAYSLYFNSDSEHATINALNYIVGDNPETLSLKENLTHKARYLGVLPPDPEEVAKLRSKIMSLAYEVNKHHTMLNKLEKLRSHNPGSATLNQTPQQIMQDNTLNHIEDINQLNAAVRQKEVKRVNEQITKQNNITLMKYNLRKGIQDNKDNVASFIRENKQKLPDQLLDMINDITISNSKNWSRLLLNR